MRWQWPSHLLLPTQVFGLLASCPAQFVLSVALAPRFAPESALSGSFDCVCPILSAYA